MKKIEDIFKDFRTSLIRGEVKEILRKINKRRLKNIVVSYLARKSGFMLSDSPRPVTIFIETVKGCNFNCVMCRAGELAKSYMSFETFKKLVDLFQDSLYVFPYVVGEPMLNKDIYKMIKYSSQVKKQVVLVISNFSVISPEELVKSEPVEVSASIDSVNPEKFSKIRVNGNLNQVLGNVEKLIEVKKNLRSYLPVVSFNTTLMRENSDEVEDIVKVGISMGVNKFYFQTVFKADFLNIYGEIPELYSIERVRELKNKYKGKAKIFLISYYEYERGDYFSGYCQWAFSSLCIDVDGYAFPCYILFSQRQKNFGNIFADYDKVMRRRAEFIKNFRKKRPDICEGCPLYFRNASH